MSLFMTASGRAQTHRTLSQGSDEMGYPTKSAQARELGQMEARRDLSNGVMIVKTAGLPNPDWEDYAELLKARCNVKLELVGGCLVSAGEMDYMGGYNEISSAAVQRRYGTNIFKRLKEQAETRYQSRMESYRPPPNRPLNSPGTYRVKPGDTLSTIAAAHGLKASALSKANPGVDAKRLQIGQKIQILKNALP